MTFVTSSLVTMRLPVRDSTLRTAALPVLTALWDLREVLEVWFGARVPTSVLHSAGFKSGLEFIVSAQKQLNHLQPHINLKGLKTFYSCFERLL